MPDTLELSASPESLIALTRRAFEPGGVVEQIMGEHRPLQGELAETIARHMTRGRNPEGDPGIGMGSASTGLGKTLAYSVVLLLKVALSRQSEPDPQDAVAHRTWRRQRVRGLISTFTLGLREQLVPTRQRERPGDLSRASQIVSQVMTEAGLAPVHCRPVTFAIRPSRTAYLSADRIKALTTFLANPAIQQSDAFLAREFIGIAKEALRHQPLFEIQEFFETYDTLPFGLDHLDLCLTESEAARHPEFSKLLEDSRTAEVLVVTHAMLSLHNLTFHSLLDQAATGRLSAVVIDEADRLPTAARSVSEATINLVALRQNLEDIREVPEEPLQTALTELQGVRRSLDRLYDRHNRKPNRPFAMIPLAASGDTADLLPGVNALRDALVALRDALPDDPQTVAMAGYLETVEDQFRHFIEMFEGPSSSLSKVAASWTYGRPVLQWSPTREFPRIGVAAHRPGWLANTLWRVKSSRIDTVYMLSGSLLAGEGLKPDGRPAFRWFRRIIGAMPNHNVHEDLFGHYEPQRFGQMFFVLADRRVPSPSLNRATITEVGDALWTNPKYLDYVASMIQAAHRTPLPWSGSPGRVLVLNTSHHDKQALHDRLHKSIGPLVLHRPGEGIARLLEDFRDDPDCVLLTTHWEGIDLPSLVDNIVITRLPIFPVSEANVAVSQLALERDGHTGKVGERAAGYEFNDTIEMAVHRLLQGLGRGLRTPRDRCRIWIADPRFPLPASLILPHDTTMATTSDRLGERFVPAVPARFRNSLFSSLNYAQIFSLDGSLIETFREAAE